MAHVEFEAKASELREAIDLVKTSTGNALQSLQGASLSTVMGRSLETSMAPLAMSAADLQ